MAAAATRQSLPPAAYGAVVEFHALAEPITESVAMSHGQSSPAGPFRIAG